MRDWVHGSDGRWVSMSIVSSGEYGVPAGLVYGMPVICEGGSYRVVQGIPIDDFARARIDASARELAEEMAAVREILGIAGN